MTLLSFVAYNKYRDRVRNQGGNDNKSHFIHLVNEYIQTSRREACMKGEGEPPKLPGNTKGKGQSSP